MSIKTEKLGGGVIAIDAASIPPVTTQEALAFAAEALKAGADTDNDTLGICALMLARVAAEREALLQFKAAVEEGWELRGSPSQSKTIN
jgi:hypothetical protein